jgi:hypothetical protein
MGLGFMLEFNAWVLNYLEAWFVGMEGFVFSFGMVALLKLELLLLRGAFGFELER